MQALILTQHVYQRALHLLHRHCDRTVPEAATQFTHPGLHHFGLVLQFSAFPLRRICRLQAPPDSDPSSPQKVSLTGTGIGPAVRLSPSSVTFLFQLVGTTSTLKAITLSNSGNSTLYITSIIITGAASGDFVFDSSTTCLVTGGSVARGGSCKIGMRFKPTTGGTRTASVSISDNASGSPQTIPLNGVGKYATTTTARSNLNPSTFGQLVTFTATVSSSGGSPPDGEMVTFKNGSTVLGTARLSGGSASFSTSTLSAGSHTITAVYAGDATLASSSGSLVQGINKAASTMTFSSSPNPSTAGQTVTFTAVVSSSAGTPIGTVTFKHGSTVLGTAVVDATGTATFSTNSLAAGSDVITASYGGSTNYKTSSASLTQVVR
jgi:hypothetical protein